MNEKSKAVWLEIEKGVGRCCLHKKSALNEAMGLPSNVMSLATTASEKDIEAFLGDTRFEKNQDRYSFNYHGVSVDLTTFNSVADKEELYRKIFMHALSIDSIGFDSSGKKANRYHGLQDIENKVLRLTSPGVSVSEGLMKRILQYVADGFTVEKGLREKIEQEKYFKRPSFRRKLAEVLTALMEDESKDWSDVARVIDLVSNLEHRKAVVAFTNANTDDKNDPKVRRNYEFLIFAFSGATSKEISPSLQGEKALDYYDSVCSNISMRVKTLADFKNLKMLDVSEFYEELRYLIDEFDESHNYLWQAGFNGRNGGYLVLYQGFAKPSEYKSYCRKCGQKNYKSITENGNKCGHCGAEARVDFIKPPLQIGTYPGKSTDMDEDFEEWDIYSLRKRVQLVQEFDRLCDDLLARTVEMLEQYDVVEETVMRPEKIKVLCEVAS